MRETLPTHGLSPFVRLSIALHLGALALAVWNFSLWPLALGVVVANQLAITAAGLLPRCRLLGPNWVRLPPAAIARREVALTLDDGPDPQVTPQVLDILDRHGAKATFFCIGERARAHPELCREIVRRGHAVESHSQHHRHHFALLGPNGFERELQQAQATLEALTNTRPIFFRAPAGLRNPFLQPVLARLGLRLASWTRRGFDTRVRDADQVTESLLRDLDAGDILLLHDGNAARTRAGTPVILEVLPRLLGAIAAAGLRPVTLRSCVPEP